MCCVTSMPNFIMRLALGETALVWDAGSRGRGGPSQAQWQGLPWIRYSLERAWYLPVSPTLVRGSNVRDQFDRQYRRLSKRTRRRLRYFRPFVAHTHCLEVVPGWVTSSLDGRYAELAAILAAHERIEVSGKI